MARAKVIATLVFSLRSFTAFLFFRFALETCPFRNIQKQHCEHRLRSLRCGAQSSGSVYHSSDCRWKSMEKTLIGYCYTLQKAKITELYTLPKAARKNHPDPR